MGCGLGTDLGPGPGLRDLGLWAQAVVCVEEGLCTSRAGALGLAGSLAKHTHPTSMTEVHRGPEGSALRICRSCHPIPHRGRGRRGCGCGCDGSEPGRWAGAGSGGWDFERHRGWEWGDSWGLI